MTDLSTSHTITIPTARLLRLLHLLRPRKPTLEIGRALATTPQAYSVAIALAYVAPWANLPKREQKPVPDEDLQGRDPNW